MHDTWMSLLIFGAGEVVALFVFWVIARIFHRKLTLSSVLRGLLERGFIYVTLINKLPQALAFFGALKIATRLSDDDKISNDYFLVGNLISVSLAIGYYLLRVPLKIHL